MEYVFKAMPRWLADRKLPDDCTPNRKKTIVRASRSYKLEDNEMYHISLKYGNRLCILDQERANSILRECHNNNGVHFGVNRTQANIAKRYFWPSFSSDVRKWINACEQCQKMNPSQSVGSCNEGLQYYSRRSGFRPIYVTERWDTLQIDIVGPLPQTQSGKKYILVITDLFSNYIKAFNMRTNTAEETSSKIIKIFYELGLPNRMITDQGPKFVNQINDILGMTRVITLACMLASDEEDASNPTNQKIKSFLTRFANDHPYDWNQYLPGAIFEMNTTKSCGSVLSPFNLMYFRKPRGFDEQDINISIMPHSSTQHLNNGKLDSENHNLVSLKIEQLNSEHMNSRQLNNSQFKGDQINIGHLDTSHLNTGQIITSQLNLSQLNNVQLNNIKLNGLEMHVGQTNEEVLSSLQMGNIQLHNIEMNNGQLKNVQINGNQLNGIQLSRINMNNVDLNGGLMNTGHLMSANSQLSSSHLDGGSGILNIGQLNNDVGFLSSGNIDSNNGQLNLNTGQYTNMDINTSLADSFVHFASGSHINLLSSIDTSSSNQIIIDTNFVRQQNNATSTKNPQSRCDPQNIVEAQKIEADYASQMQNKIKIKAYYIDKQLKRRAQTIIIGSKIISGSDSAKFVKKQYKLTSDWNGPFKNFLVNKYKFKL